MQTYAYVGYCVRLQDFIMDENKPMSDRLWVWLHYGTAYRSMYTLPPGLCEQHSLLLQLVAGWPTLGAAALRLLLLKALLLLLLPWVTKMMAVVVQVVVGRCRW